MIGPKKTVEVFGVSNTILSDSYVDRGALDKRIQTLLQRPTHIALRGESKCGKSWLRQKNLPNAITVQCRLKKTAVDIYIDALSQMGVRLTVESTSGESIKGSVEASGEAGISIFAKLGFKTSGSAESSDTSKFQLAGHDVNDLRFIAEIIKSSGRRLVIEDFHYMSIDERRNFSFDLKALWDFGVFVIIIGVWSQTNMLTHLNPDLTGRLEEASIYWSESDLGSVMDKGGSALNIQFSEQVKKQAISECFGNSGILQKLILGTLDELDITQANASSQIVESLDALEAAAMGYAEQLNPLYQQFAKRVSTGIRKRENSTGIYAYAMAVILDAPDADLLKGLQIDEMFKAAHARQSRIQKGNLRKILEKFEGLQVDHDGRGLVLSYNDQTEEISIVDRQLLLYRKYATVKWPWEEMIKEAEISGDDFKGG